MHVAFVSALYAYGTEPGSSPSPLMPVTIASCGLLSQRLDAGTRPMLAHLSLTPATSFLQSGKEERCPLFPARTKSRFPILRADALQDDRASGTIAAPVGRFPRPASGWAIPLGFFFLPPSLPLVRPSSGSRSQVLPLREIKGRKDKLMTIYTDTARYDTGRAMTELRRAAPSIFATTTHESRSERFQPIPTIDVLRGLMKEGFVPIGAKQSSSRIAGKADFTKHLIRLCRIDDGNIYNVGDTVCEILLKNANDDTSAYELLAGLFRLLPAGNKRNYVRSRTMSRKRKKVCNCWMISSRCHP